MNVAVTLWLLIIAMQKFFIMLFRMGRLTQSTILSIRVCDPMAVDKDGFTPLHLAAKNVRTLLLLNVCY